MMTIIGSTKAVLRSRDCSGRPKVRSLSGKELLAFTGWFSQDFIGGGTAISDAVLTSLAGNAFNAWSSGSVLACTLPLIDAELHRACAIDEGETGIETENILLSQASEAYSD